MMLSPLLGASSLAAHEYWIAPESYEVAPEASLIADLVNGQKFRGHALPYLPHQTRRFELWQNGAGQEVAARAGDRPAFHTPVQEGLAVLVYESTPSTVRYAVWEKFEAFVAHKDLGVTLAEHEAQGWPTSNFTEVYTRYSKSLIKVGAGAGADRAVGMETELVALANPYLGADSLPVRLDYQGKPQPDHQIEVFDQGPDGEVVISTLRTDANGIGHVPVAAGHVYMLDSVTLRIPDPALAKAYDAVYETLWANLTFAVPAS